MPRCSNCNDEVIKWMSYCPSCDDELQWPVAKGMDECSNCGSPAHPKFNYCFACGLDFEEEHESRQDVRGFKLDWACDNEDCDGAVALFMLFCPWCGEQQEWDFDQPATLEYRDITSGTCEGSDGCGSPVDPFWFYCAFCGEEIPQAHGRGRSPGSRPYGKGLHTCMQYSAQWQSRIMVTDESEPLPVCRNCGIHGSWIRGK